MSVHPCMLWFRNGGKLQNRTQPCIPTNKFTEDLQYSSTLEFLVDLLDNDLHKNPLCCAAHCGTPQPEEARRASPAPALAAALHRTTTTQSTEATTLRQIPRWLWTPNPPNAVVPRLIPGILVFGHFELCGVYYMYKIWLHMIHCGLLVDNLWITY